MASSLHQHSTIVLGHRPHTRQLLPSAVRRSSSLALNAAELRNAQPEAPNGASERPLPATARSRALDTAGSMRLVVGERPLARQRSPYRALDLFPIDAAIGAASSKRANSTRRAPNGGGLGLPQAAGPARRPSNPATLHDDTCDEFGDFPNRHRHGASGPSAPQLFGPRPTSTASSIGGGGGGACGKPNSGALLFPRGDDLCSADPFPTRSDARIPIVVEERWRPIIADGVASTVFGTPNASPTVGGAAPRVARKN